MSALRIARTAPESTSTTSFFRRLAAEWYVAVPLLVALIVVYQTIVPLAVMLIASIGLVLSPDSGGLSLRGYIEAYTASRTWTTLANSIQFGIGATLLALAIGLTLGWLVQRTDIGFKSLLYGLAIVPLMLPGLITTIGWIVLLGPNAGWVNQLYRALNGGQEALININSLPGMIAIEAFSLTPFAFVLFGAAFQSMDTALEEAGAVSGGGSGQVFRRITLPLLTPALIGTSLICFVRALEAFEVPVVVGAPSRIYLLTSEVYFAFRKYPADYQYGAAISVGLVAITAIGIWLHGRAIAEGRRFQTVTGKGFRPRPIQLGKLRYPALAMISLYFFIATGLPLLTLLLLSLQPFTRAPSIDSLSHPSLVNYSVLLSPLVLKAAGNSLFLGLVSATFVSLLSAVVAWIVTKSKLPMRGLLDFAAFVPIGVPGIIIGISFIFLYLTIPIPIYGTIWILVLAYTTKFLPFGTRTNVASTIQVQDELIEAASVSGASWPAVFRRVLLPLILPGLLGGWIYVFIIAFRELSTSALLGNLDNIVLVVLLLDIYEDGRLPAVAAVGTTMVIFMLLVVALAAKFGARFGVRSVS